jgi:DNA-binding NarL/FixJ family response regulator
MKHDHSSAARRSATLEVALIEDDAIVRGSFADLINGTPGLSCNGEYESCESALKAFERSTPHVVLMDIGLPGMSGIKGARLLKERYPFLDILMLTVYDDDEQIFQSICAGASGYVLKNSEPSELVRAIFEIQTGAPMSASIARRVLSFVRRQGAPPSPDLNLTPREDDILQSLVEGLSYKKIAARLFISPLTVHTHIKRIYEKLQVHSRGEAVSKAMKRRLFGG